jgi:hypothetical protein
MAAANDADRLSFRDILEKTHASGYLDAKKLLMAWSLLDADDQRSVNLAYAAVADVRGRTVPWSAQEVIDLYVRAVQSREGMQRIALWTVDEAKNVDLMKQVDKARLPEGERN